ncbi:neurobeachin-like protein 1 [Physella acuta]|uniref:neurobeachin-like protein 1 n=1 Tax=Physella acuta TaxID=109671 RepID=UPI0027DDB1AD|nr:neurobeachin-like protein 1 [Physella acuta]
MEDEIRKQTLHSKWELYVSKKERSALEDYIKEFINFYSHYFDLDFQHLSEGLYNESPHLTQHPESILDCLGQATNFCSADFIQTFDLESLELFAAVLKCLVIICRNYDNVVLVASCDFVKHSVHCTQVILSKLCSQTEQLDVNTVSSFVSFVQIVLHFFECLYDPYFVWRKRLKGWIVDVEQLLSKPALVHNEVIPFFHECFQKPSLSYELQFSLLHMFGAVMSGSQSNATLTVTPATLDVLLSLLSGRAACYANVPADSRIEIQCIVLRCVVSMIHTIHGCSPDERQVEVPEVLSNYVQVMLNICSTGQEYQMLVLMIDSISDMLNCVDKLALQALLISDDIFEALVSLIKKSKLQGKEFQVLACSVVRAVQALLTGSSASKAMFEKCVGFKEFFEILHGCEQPTIELLMSLLDFVVESSYVNTRVHVIRNAPVAVFLIEWLKSIQSHDMQVWLSEEMKKLCTESYGNRMACCKGKMVGVVISVLSEHSKLQFKTVGHLIYILERLGNLSISAGELKSLICLMKPGEDKKQYPYTTRLMRAISTMARRDGICGPLHFFDIQNLSDAINLPGTRKWPGAAFSFFTLMCLEPSPSLDNVPNLRTTASYRRILYSFSCNGSNGFEAFITPDLKLTVATFSKKEYCSFTVNSVVLDDGLWHSVCVVHVAGRRFSNSPGQVHVYIDGVVRANTTLKFPNLSEPFNICNVGSPDIRTRKESISEIQVYNPTEPKKVSPLKAMFSFSRGTDIPTQGTNLNSQTIGTQEETWGPATCLYGQLESICVFHDVLTSEHVKALNNTGTNSLFSFSSEAAIADLPTKLFARYSAKACKGNICADLSPFQNNGIFSGNKCINWDLKDVINCIGGIQVLFPLLEMLDQSLLEWPEESPSSPSKLEAEELDLDEWAVVDSRASVSSELKLEHNQLAAFITMVRHILKGKSVNKDNFVRAHCASTLGMLMQKVPKDMMDVTVLMSVQYLHEDCNDGSNQKSTLLQHIYHYILFDFSLWSQTYFAVRIGHIQYINTIIKDDRKYFRKKYGVQFFLDVIRAYYSSPEVSCLGEEDSKSIRVSLLQLIKFYFMNNIRAEELNQLMGFLLAVKQPTLLLEAMDLLISLLESRSRKQDQLVLLLYEPDQAEMFYKLLTYQNQPIIFYEKVVKILHILLKTDKVYEKSKARLRLADIGHWGLVNLMMAYDISAPMIKRFIEQVSFTETPQTYSAVLAILGLVHSCGLDIKSEASRQLLAIIVSKSGSTKGFAKQLGWQENITRLLALERRRAFSLVGAATTLPNSTIKGSASNISEDSGTQNMPGFRPHLSHSSSISSSSAYDTTSVTATIRSCESADPTAPDAISEVSSTELNIPNTSLPVLPESFSPDQNNSASPDTIESPTRPTVLPFHPSSTIKPIRKPSETDDVIASMLEEPTPNTPLYIKRNFYDMETPDVDEGEDIQQGSRSSSASVEDLLRDTSSCGGDVSANVSNISVSSSPFEGDDSALGNSQSSIASLGNSTGLNDSLRNSQNLNDSLRNSQSLNASLKNSQQTDEWRRFSADNILEGLDDSRRASTVLQGETFRKVLDHIGVQLTDALEQREELCQNILIILWSIMWKGIDGSSIEVWKERLQVFTWIDELGDSHELIRPPVEIKRRLLEMLLHNCTSDIRSAGSQPPINLSENAVQLIRLVQGFVTKEDLSADVFSNRLLEDVMSLLDALGVWGTEAQVAWTEMVHRGFCILLAFSKQPDLGLVSSATVKLHSLVQTKLISSSAEASYILGVLNSMVMKAIEENSDNYSYLMPVLRALIEKGKELLTISINLPHLPKSSMSQTFFDDFKTYVYSEEWQTFINNYVRPQMTHFIESNFEEGVVFMADFWSECREDMMMNHHKHNREIGESRLKFKNQIEEVYRKKADHENRRFQNMMAQQKNHHLFALRQWRATKRFFTGERGAWKDKNQQEVHWKLSNQENFQRMKVKLTQNYNFDSHLNASLLRDNVGVIDTDTSIQLEELKKVKDALVSKENIADDTLGDEEWSAISASSANMEEYSGTEKLIISADCELITVTDDIKGRLEVTSTHVYFFDCSMHKEEGGEDFKWSLSRLREIHFRRYNLRRSALEVFLIDQTNYFINFPEKQLRNRIYSHILSLRPLNLTYKGQRSPGDLLKASGLTQKWVNREISNFEYLMQLNTIAGRTYNDLSQYHVFPWILMDYTSKHLDLENPKTFRDLSKPIGVVSARNEEEVREKFETFEDPSGTIEKFHYGTHYSNAASVMHYMVRVEPFTTLHIELQSGKFDVADRQFHSIPGSFSSLMDNPNDVKELIPEFFYFPEFLVNFNGFDLGRLQITKEQVNDVKLPPWASTPEEFIYKHRQALESEFVSANLHNWIDLIFGYKQKGPAAVEALNVFYYVTYEGAVDLDAIEDPKERLSVEGMIRNFGQTPSQLLKEPHPRRFTFEEAVARTTKSGKPMAVFNFLKDLKPYFVEVSNGIDPLVFVNVPKSQSRSILQQGMPDSLVTITEDGIIGVHGWLPFDKSIPNFYTFDKDPTMLNVKTKKRVGGSFSPGLKITAKLFVVSHDAKLLFSGGHWDNSLQVYNLVRPKVINHIVRHIDIITCLALDNCGRHLVTGSRDTTCMVWEIIQQAGVSVNLSNKPLQTLYGHDSEVTAVHISTELDLVVSASKDGTVILHTVHKGHYTMTLRAPSQMGWTLDIPLMAVSDTGQIVLYCVEMEKQAGEGRKRQQERHCLHLYSVNGKHLFSEPLQHSLGDMCMSGDHLVLGNDAGQLIVMEIFGLRPMTTMELLVPIQCVTLSNGSSHVLAGLKDGKLIIVGNKGKN